MTNEKRPFIVGESVYIMYRDEEQELGTIAMDARIIKDDGSDKIVTTAGYVAADRLRRNRRGVKSPIYSEVPLG